MAMTLSIAISRPRNMRRCVSMAATLALARVATVGCADLQLKLGWPVELQALTTKGASICGIPACLVGFESVVRGSSGRALVRPRGGTYVYPLGLAGDMAAARACLQLRHKTVAPFVNEEELAVLGPKEWTPYVRLHATDPGRDGARRCEVVTGPPEKKRDLLAFALPGLVVLSTGRVRQMAKRGERAYEEVAKAAVVGDVVEALCGGIPHFLSRSKTCAEAVQEMLRPDPTSGGERAADGG